MNQEFKDKASKALNTGVKVVGKISLVVYELVVKIFKTTIKKRANNADRSAAGDTTDRNVSSVNKNQVDEKYYLYRHKWLFQTWVLSNIVVTYYCYETFDAMSRISFFRDARWGVFIGWLIALFLCRLVYELVTASYEKVIYLRRIHEEMMRHNAWEEAEFRKGKE